MATSTQPPSPSQVRLAENLKEASKKALRALDRMQGAIGEADALRELARYIIARRH